MNIQGFLRAVPSVPPGLNALAQRRARTIPDLLLATALAVCLGATATAAQTAPRPGAPRTVLAIHWGPPDFPLTPGVNDAIRESLSKSGDAVDLFAEYLESDRLSHELHPATLRLMGLATALKAHCTEVGKRHHLEVGLATDGEFSDLHPDVAVCFFRIAQESIRNGIDHGAAKRIAVSLVRSGEHVELTVTDDGRGFDVETVRRNGGGLGLVSIEERADAVGGVVQILTGLGKGTTIRVRGPAGSGASVQ
jgi:signal transduction histidine kinase